MKQADDDEEMPERFKGEPLLKVPPDFNERVMQRIREEEELARESRRAILVAVAVLVAIVLAIWGGGRIG